MKLNLIALVVLFLSSCSSMEKAMDTAPYRAAYVNYTQSDYTTEEADGFGSIPGAEVGLMYGGSEESEPGRVVGLVGDIALRGQLGDGDFEGTGVDVESLGVRTGLRYYFDTGSRWAQPFLGGGLLVQHTWLSDEVSDADKTAVGGYGMLGLESALSDHARLSVGYMLTAGIEPEVDGQDIDLDSGALMIGLGWSF